MTVKYRNRSVFYIFFLGDVSDVQTIYRQAQFALFFGAIFHANYSFSIVRSLPAIKKPS